MTTHYYETKPTYITESNTLKQGTYMTTHYYKTNHNNPLL